MRSIYLTLAGIFAFIGTIICFSNILIATPIMIGFTYMGGNSIFFPLVIILTIGFISGFFFGLAIMSSRRHDVVDETDDLDL